MSTKHDSEAALQQDASIPATWHLQAELQLSMADVSL